MPLLRRLGLLSLSLLLPGCLLLPPGQVFPADDDDTTADDDDTVDDDDSTGDDDDTTGDDDDSTAELPPCEFDDEWPVENDNDGDGWPSRSIGDVECDCDDDAFLVYPGADEVFDLTINDCDAQIDAIEIFEAPGTVDVQPGALFDSDGTDNELATHYSVGDLNNDGAADLCVRGRTEAWVLMGYASAFQADLELDSWDLINITGLDPNGSIDCSANINGERGTDLVINHFPDDSSGSGGPSLIGGGEILMFDGDEVADALILFTSDANAVWPQATTQVGWKGLCLGTGDFLAQSGVEIVTAELPLGNRDDDVTFHILGYQSIAQQEIFVSRETVDASGVDDIMEVQCWGLGDVSDGGRDDVLLDGGTATELWFGEQLGLGGDDSAMLTFDGLAAISATSGDFTGDGVADLAMGTAMWSSAGGSDTAGVLIRGGLTNGEWAEAEGLDGLVNPLYGVNFGDTRDGTEFGTGVCNVGDVDLDGRDELIFTAPGNDDTLGEGRLYAGRGWDDWATGLDNNLHARGTETTRLVGSTLGGQMGYVGACNTAPPSSVEGRAWAMVNEPWAWPSAGDEMSRLWVWESFPGDP